MLSFPALKTETQGSQFTQWLERSAQTTKVKGVIPTWPSEMRSPPPPKKNQTEKNSDLTWRWWVLVKRNAPQLKK